MLEAAGKPDVDERLAAVQRLIAEETRVSMLIGVAVGYELAHELMRTEGLTRWTSASSASRPSS